MQLPRNNNRTNEVYVNVLHWKLPKHSPETLTSPVGVGKTVTFECSNGFLQNELPLTSHALSCDISGKYNRTYLYEDLMCRSDFHKSVVVSRAYSIQSRLLKCEGKNLEIYNVETRKPDGSLKHLFTVCLDKSVMRTKFAFQPKSNVRPLTKYRSRQDVWGFDAYGENSWERVILSRAYVKKLQETRITSLFPDQYKGGKKYPYYFNRGHLVPYGDFIDDEDQHATCLYINAAPQWNEFNENAWSLIEQEARRIRNKGTPEEWEIYTGTYGKIPAPREGFMFLTAILDDNKNVKKRLVPVPLLFWKIVHNVNDRSKSRAFIGVNNPRIKSATSVTNEYRVCTPIVNPVTKKAINGNEFEGFTYECKLDDFLKKLGTDEGIVV